MYVCMYVSIYLFQAYLWTHGEKHAARRKKLNGAHEGNYPEAAHGKQQFKGLESEGGREGVS